MKNALSIIAVGIAMAVIGISVRNIEWDVAPIEVKLVAKNTSPETLSKQYTSIRRNIDRIPAEKRLHDFRSVYRADDWFAGYGDYKALHQQDVVIVSTTDGSSDSVTWIFSDDRPDPKYLKTPRS